MAFKAKAPSISSVGTTSTEASPANPGRLYLSITNTHATQKLYVNFGRDASAADGIEIDAGATKEWGLYNREAVPGGAVNVIANGAATTFCLVEGDGRQVGDE